MHRTVWPERLTLRRSGDYLRFRFVILDSLGGSATPSGLRRGVPAGNRSSFHQKEDRHGVEGYRSEEVLVHP